MQKTESTSVGSHTPQVWEFIELVARGNTEPIELEAMAEALLESRCHRLQDIEASTASQLLHEIYDGYCDLDAEQKADIKGQLWMLSWIVRLETDSMCALCSHRKGEHAHDGDWCPNPASEDQLFNCSQKFVADLQSLRKGA